MPTRYWGCTLGMKEGEDYSVMPDNPDLKWQTRIIYTDKVKKRYPK